MSLLPLRRRSARHHEEPMGELPAPGPFPAARQPQHAIGIFLVVLVVVIWLVAHGYSVDAALGAVAGAGVVAAAVTSRLAGPQPGDG
jgi:hypothetical protein